MNAILHSPLRNTTMQTASKLPMLLIWRVPSGFPMLFLLPVDVAPEWLVELQNKGGDPYELSQRDWHLMQKVYHCVWEGDWKQYRIDPTVNPPTLTECRVIMTGWLP